MVSDLSHAAIIRTIFGDQKKLVLVLDVLLLRQGHRDTCISSKNSAALESDRRYSVSFSQLVQDEVLCKAS